MLAWRDGTVSKVFAWKHEDLSSSLQNLHFFVVVFFLNEDVMAYTLVIPVLGRQRPADP